MSRQVSSLLFMIGILAVALFIGWGIVSAVQTALKPPTLPGVSNVATQAQQLFNPTPTIYPSAATVILQVQRLARLETSQYTVEKVITAESGQGAFGSLFGDKLLFVAHGKVIAGVDLQRLGPNDVIVNPTDGSVTIIMPAAEVFIATLDNDKSFVYDRQTGLFTKGDINLETLARQAAEKEILNAALEDGILRTSQTNANVYVDSLLRTLNFTKVMIIQATPQP